ncbi:Renin receptor [Halocaridina rubra]|uniref:Renin receptor n=1 Tax=Halocaridina rubra TaxID=373956 RepID=A0AAN8XE53_HALRR
MASQLMRVIPIFYLISTVYCGEVTVVHAPSTLRFGSASTLRASNLDDIITSALGYTPKESSPWNGLTITSPFSLPLSAVLLEVHGGGAIIRQEGTTYSLKEDLPMDEVYHNVKSIVGSRAQRETLFRHFNIDDDLTQEGLKTTIPASKTLNLTREPDSYFLREMAALLRTAMTVDDMTTTSHGGQDVIFFEISGLAPLVKVYGNNSPQVEEAVDIVRNQLVRVTDMLRRVYNDEVLVVSATVDRLKVLSRPSRSILAADELGDLNLASEYSDDYPAIFNIVLWLSILLLLFIIGSAFAMATMDPGQDSIIYRMTNPRMKKDN